MHSMGADVIAMHGRTQVAGGMAAEQRSATRLSRHLCSCTGDPPSLTAKPLVQPASWSSLSVQRLQLASAEEFLSRECFHDGNWDMAEGLRGEQH